MEPAARPGGPEERLGPRLAAALLLVVLAALWVAWGLRGDAPPPERGPEAPLQAAAPSVPQAPAPRVDPRIGTGDVEAAAVPPPADLELPYEFTLQLRVVDRDGLPVADARLFAAPALCGFGLVDGTTDRRGRLDFRCHGRAGELELWLAVMAFGTVEPLHFVTLQADVPRVLAVAVRGRAHEPRELLKLLNQDTGPEMLGAAADRMREELQRKQGQLPRRDALDTLCGRQLFLFRAIECASCHRPNAVASYLPLQWAPLLWPSLHPAAIFRDMLLAPPTEEDRKVEPPPRDLQLAQQVRLQKEHGAYGLGVVRGTVRTRAGAPADSVAIAWISPDGAVRSQTRSEARGSYQLPVRGNVPCTIVAAGGGLGRAEAVVVAPATYAVVQDLELVAADTVRGTAHDAAGAPLVGWDVTFEGVDEPGAALTTTGEGGAFALAQLPRSGRCLLWPKDDDLRLPVVASDTVMPDAAVQLRLAAPARARLRLHPRLPQSHPHARLEIRVVQLETGRAAHVQAISFDDAFDLEGLPAGFYRGEIGAQGLGWVPFGPVHLDGRGLWDLGVVVLPSPGRVRLVADGGNAPHATAMPQFCRRRDDTDIVVPAHAIAEGLVELPAGDYALLWRQEGGVRSQAVRVTQNAETVVRLVP